MTEIVSRRGWARRLLVVVGLLLAAIALAGGIAAVLLSWYGPRFAREELERTLTDRLGRPVRVQAIRHHLWRGRISVAGVTVEPPGDAADATRARVERVDVDLRLESLWRRQVVLAVTATGLDLDLTTGGGGEGGGSIGVPEELAAGPVTVRLAVIRLADSRLVVRAPDGSWAVEASGLAADGRPRAAALRLAVGAERLRLRVGTREEILERVRITGSVGAERIEVERARARWEGHDLELAGEVRQPWTAAELHGTLRGKVALAPVLRRSGPAGPAEGTAEVELVLAGPARAPRVSGRITATSLAVGGTRVSGLALRGAWQESALRLDEARAEIFGVRLAGGLSAAPGRDGAWRIALRLDEVRGPAALTELLGTGRLGAEARVAGSAVEILGFEARWPGARLDLRGRLTVGERVALRIGVEVARPPSGSGQQLPAAGQLTAELTGPWEAPVLSGRVATSGLAAGVLTVARAEIPLRLEGSDGWRHWAGTIGGGRIAAGPVTLEALEGEIHLDRHRVGIAGMRGRVHGAPLRASGTLSWQGEGRVTAEIGPLALATLPGLPAGLGLSGTASAAVDATIRAGGLATTAVAHLRDVSLGSIPLGPGRIEASLTGPAVMAEAALPDLRLRATAEGRLGAGRSLTVRARLERWGFGPALAQTWPGGTGQLDGVVSVSAEALVPLDRPLDTRIDARVQADSLVVAGERWTASGPASLRWEAGRLTVDRIRLSGPRGTLDASVRREQPGGDIRLSARLDGAPLPGVLERLGRGSVEATAALGPEALDVAGFRARWPGGTIDLAGRVRLDGGLALRASATAVLDDLGRPGGAGLAGRAGLTAEIAGDWKRPVARGSLDSGAVTLRGVSVSAVRVPFELTSRSLQVTAATARIDGERVGLSGRASWGDQPWQARGTFAVDAVRVRGWSLERIRGGIQLDGDSATLTDVTGRLGGFRLPRTPGVRGADPGRPGRRSGRRR